MGHTYTYIYALCKFCQIFYLSNFWNILFILAFQFDLRFENLKDISIGEISESFRENRAEEGHYTKGSIPGFFEP